MSRSPLRSLLGGLAALIALSAPSPAGAQIWPQFYDPVIVRTLNLTMSAQDWETVRNDLTFNVEAAAQLSLPGEPPVLVAVRRKSGVAIPMVGGPSKVPLKIDINEYVEQSWHGVKKLSLENGGDTSTLLEGFAWYLHRRAWTPGGYPYMPGLASWVRVYVNGQDFGVYVSVEQVDKRFLEWRGAWLSDDTWLYKQSDIGTPTIEFGGPSHSPTYTTLCYSPFPPQTCPTPSPATVATQLTELIDMQGMLTLGAVNAWCYSPDELFSKGKNHYFCDSRYRKRLYYPWDLDASFSSLDPTHSIYQLGNSPYVPVILDNPTFRAQYNTIMQTLINGPFATANLTATLNSLEGVLLPAMSTDPYNPVTASEFTALRNYVSARNTNVASQLAGGSVSVPPSEHSVSLSAVPNPSHDRTRVAFHMGRPGTARVSVFDAQGARVKTLLDGPIGAGPHHVDWEGTDDQGRSVGAGVYFIGCRVEGRTWSQRVVRL